MYLLQLVLWFSLLPGFLEPETERYSFTVFWGDDEIGEIHADQTLNGNQSSYRVFGDSHFRVVWKYQQQFVIEMEFEDGLLHYDSSKDYLNKKLKKHCITDRNGNKYLRSEGDERLDPLAEDIRFTTALLYFKEPLGLDKIYSDHYQEFAPIEDLGNHRYRIDLPGKRTNYYTYSQGMLQLVEVERTWFKLTFVRKS